MQSVFKVGFLAFICFSLPTTAVAQSAEPDSRADPPILAEDDPQIGGSRDPLETFVEGFLRLRREADDIEFDLLSGEPVPPSTVIEIDNLILEHRQLTEFVQQSSLESLTMLLLQERHLSQLQELGKQLEALGIGLAPNVPEDEWPNPYDKMRDLVFPLTDPPGRSWLPTEPQKDAETQGDTNNSTKSDDGIPSVLDDIGDVIQLQPGVPTSGGGLLERLQNLANLCESTAEARTSFNLARSLRLRSQLEDEINTMRSELKRDDVAPEPALKSTYDRYVAALQTIRQDVCSPDREDTPEIVYTNPYEARVAQFRAEIAAVKGRCTFQSYSAIRPRIDAFYNELQDIYDGNSDITDYRQINDAVWALVDLEMIRLGLLAACDPAQTFGVITIYHDICDRKGVEEGLADLAAIIRVAREEIALIQAGNGPAGLSAEKAQARLDQALDYQKKTQQLDWSCEDKESDEDARNETSAPQAPDKEQVAEPDPCAIRPDGTDPCVSWRPLLGRWRDQNGGVIEFSLSSDNTAQAVIVAASERMTKEGYAAGDLVLRGLANPASGGTWSFSASRGEAYQAALPGREPGDYLGTAQWIAQGVTFIEVGKPNILQTNGQLENRFGTVSFTRVGTFTR